MVTRSLLAYILRMSLILALESSCDETAAAIVEDGCTVIAEVVASQADAFAAWGGVVPEIAARGHVHWLPTVVEQVMQQAKIKPQMLTGIAVAAWPGLVGSLLGAVSTAKVLAQRWQLPLIAVDHVQAHLAAAHLNHEEISYPLVGLVASGGHSHYYHQEAPGVGRLLGGTIDDAAGEAFDKAASILELGYPGGPIIDRLATEGNPTAFKLPRSLLKDDRLALSFSGLKTALLYQVKGPKGRDPLTLSQAGIADAAASFQAAVVDCLLGKLEQAVAITGCQHVVIGGGVACNRGLRTGLAALAREKGWTAAIPEVRHCIDNAAMVGALAHPVLLAGQTADLDLAPLPTGAAGPRAR